MQNNAWVQSLIAAIAVTRCCNVLTRYCKRYAENRLLSGRREGQVECQLGPKALLNEIQRGSILTPRFDWAVWTIGRSRSGERDATTGTVPNGRNGSFRQLV